MKKNTYRIIIFLLLSLPVYADFDWISVTLDNDIFVGSDNGYTNGLYVSLFETNEETNLKPEYDWMAKPMLWSLPQQEDKLSINAYMMGQTMITPSDITIAVPDDNEIPYSALLGLTNSYVLYDAGVADLISTSIGIIGPAALGKQTQKFVHKIIGADEPQGWDTQIGNELVFQLTRARMWRQWTSTNEHFDLLLKAEANAGTIGSDVNGGIIFRYGRGLNESYVSSIYNNSKIINPVAINQGWHFYSSINGGYLFNQIFADGNTFKESRSVDYDRLFLELSLGFSYSWNKSSLTLSWTDANLLQTGRQSETLENLTEYGSLTFAWKF